MDNCVHSSLRSVISIAVVDIRLGMGASAKITRQAAIHSPYFYNIYTIVQWVDGHLPFNLYS